jgi:hypothetical protein
MSGTFYNQQLLKPSLQLVVEGPRRLVAQDDATLMV